MPGASISLVAISKGQTIAQSMAERFDYGQNPDKAVYAGQVDVVIVNNISRIWRGWQLLQEYVDLLTQHNVTLLCVTEGLEISNRTLFPFFQK